MVWYSYKKIENQVNQITNKTGSNVSLDVFFVVSISVVNHSIDIFPAWLVALGVILTMVIQSKYIYECACSNLKDRVLRWFLSKNIIITKLFKSI